MNDYLDKSGSSGADFGTAWGGRPPRRGWQVLKSFKNPVYRLYFYAMAGTWASMQMQMVTRSLLVYRITGSGTLLGVVALATAIPLLVLSLYGGALADRVEKRKVLIICQLASALVSLGIAFALAFNFLSEDVPGSWWILIVAGVCQGTIMGMMMPSRQAILPEIVGIDDLMNAISLNNLGMNVFRIIAPAVAGFVIDAWDFAAVYWIITLLYLISSTFLFFLPHTRPAAIQGRSTITEVFEGLRYIRQETTIMFVLLFTVGCTVLGMPFNILLPMFTESILKVGASGLGILMAVSGIGAIMVSLVLASAPNKHRGLMMIFSGLILSLALIAFSFSSNWNLSLFLVVFVGMGQTGQMAFGMTLTQYYVDPGYRGRVMSFQMLGFGLSSLGSVFGGILAETMGIQWSIGGLAIGLFVIVLAMLVFSSRLRKLD
jgi:MFS family permease